MRMKRGLVFLCAASLALPCAACGDRKDAGGNVPPPVTLRTVSMFGAEDANMVVYQQIRKEFEEEYGYITISDESSASDEQWKEGVVMDFCVGNEPDVLQFFTDANADQLVAMDKFVSLEEIRKEYPEYAAETYDWALEMVQNRDGVKRAVPTCGFWEGLYCNQDLFDAYGLPLPTDWDSLTSAIRVFQENGVIPISCSLGHVPHYWMEYLLLSCAGVDSYTSDYEKISADWVRGLSLFADLREMGGFADGTDSMDNEYAWKLFSDKQAAMLLEGNWFLPLVKDQEHTVVIPFPGVPGGKAEEGTIIGGMTSGFYITRRAWNDPARRDAAVKYVMAQTSPSAVQRYWENSGGTAVAATAVQPLAERTPLAESAMKYLKQAKRRVLPIDSRMEPTAYNELIRGIVNVSHGSPPRELLKKVLEICNESFG